MPVVSNTLVCILGAEDKKQQEVNNQGFITAKVKHQLLQRLDTVAETTQIGIRG